MKLPLDSRSAFSGVTNQERTYTPDKDSRGVTAAREGCNPHKHELTSFKYGARQWPQVVSQCVAPIVSGHRYFSVGHQCLRGRGHGHGGLYCAHHAKKYPPPASPTPTTGEANEPAAT